MMGTADNREEWESDPGIAVYCTVDHKPHQPTAYIQPFCPSLDPTSMKLNIASKLHSMFLGTSNVLIALLQTLPPGLKSSSTSTMKRDSVF